MTAQRFEAVIIGAGIAGMHMLWRLRKDGISARVIEQGTGVGGTWYWNRYPGARCDTPTLQYTLAFDDDDYDWHWTEKFAAQPEIERYLNHVADKHDLRRDMQFRTQVTSAVYDEARRLWTIETDRGDSFEATYCIAATGGYSAPFFPDIPGINEFQGERYHCSLWPKKKVDFAGKRVGFIGTGASGIQAIPVIAGEADHLFVFQRTANFSVPTRNCPQDPDEEREFVAKLPGFRDLQRYSPGGLVAKTTSSGPSTMAVGEEERLQNFEARWNIGYGVPDLLRAYDDIMTNPAANEALCDFLRDKIRATVKDPKTAKLLCPTDHYFGTKRPSIDSYYYETFNRPNVTLVDIKGTPIEKITQTGLRVGGKDYEFDVLIFATGFDFDPGALTRIDVRGRGGLDIKTLWKDAPQSFLGVMLADFPNFFMITGPTSPSTATNVPYAIDQHVDWIGDLIAHMRTNAIASVEPTLEAQAAWLKHHVDLSNATLFTKVESSYMGSNIPGKARVLLPYVGGLGNYRKTCDEIAASGYPGLVFA